MNRFIIGTSHIQNIKYIITIIIVNKCTLINFAKHITLIIFVDYKYSHFNLLHDMK